MGYTLTPPRSTGTSAQRPANPPVGWEYWETDTMRKLLWTGTAWLKTNGITETAIDSAIGSGGSVSAGGVAGVIDQFWTFPGNVYGPVEVSASTNWSSSNNSGATLTLKVMRTGFPDQSIGVARVHNNLSGYGIYRSALVQGSGLPLLGPGEYRFRLEATVEAGGAAMSFLHNRISVRW